uniref:Uncharacterized protein n=1 Tax=Helicotheca tamesis TaxID=374047 RepID=A0A7S2MMV0_9STRA
MVVCRCCEYPRLCCEGQNKERRSRIVGPKWKSVEYVFFFIILCAFGSHRAAAFTLSRPRIPQGNRDQFTVARMKCMNVATFRRRAGITMYLPPSSTSQTPPMVAQGIIAAGEGKKHRGNSFLSNSVLSDSDTLPSFPTAHGLLSPETVIRMDEIASMKNQRNGAVAYFLDTYREYGPMACLPMLSDPALLPKLTEAMRDIA